MDELDRWRFCWYGLLTDETDDSKEQQLMQQLSYCSMFRLVLECWQKTLGVLRDSPQSLQMCLYTQFYLLPLPVWSPPPPFSLSDHSRDENLTPRHWFNVLHSINHRIPCRNGLTFCTKSGPGKETCGWRSSRSHKDDSAKTGPLNSA